MITCAAPNLRLLPANGMNPGDGNKTVKMTRAQQQALHEKRLTRILDVAVAGGNGSGHSGGVRNAELLRSDSGGCGSCVFQCDRSLQKMIFKNHRTGQFIVAPRDEQNYQYFQT